jgi:cold shock CspA family protein
VREKLKGTVSKWIKSLGYGFIESDESAEELVIYHSDLIDLYELEEGQEVEFQIDRSKPRPKAIQVKVLKEENSASG